VSAPQHECVLPDRFGSAASHACSVCGWVYALNPDVHRWFRVPPQAVLTTSTALDAYGRFSRG
jgi:hypothetical protein